MFCEFLNALWTLSTPTLSFLLVVLPMGMIAGLFLPCLSRKEKPNRCVIVLSGVIWGVSGVIAGLVLYAVSEGPLFGGKNCSSDLSSFLGTSQLTLLGMVVALATYTSNMQQKIREKMPSRGNRESHIADIIWLQKADILLVVTGLVVTLRIAVTTLGHPAWFLGIVVLWLLTWIILYFAALHIRQLSPCSFCKDTTASPTVEEVKDKIQAMVPDKVFTKKEIETFMDDVKQKMVTEKAINSQEIIVEKIKAIIPQGVFDNDELNELFEKAKAAISNK